MSLQQLLDMNGSPCPCGKSHTFDAKILSGSGVLSRLPEAVAEFNAKKVYLLSDVNTYKAAGRRVQQLLEDSGIAVCGYSFPQEKVEPCEASVGSAVMHMAYDCDLIVGVGSGVINDIGKILSAISRLPYIIVGTAPSMDGYASATSSMTRDGLKISLPSRGADVIIGDTDILRQAPEKMLRAGLGDMIAKYVSICEWRIAALVCGEYYCPQIAQLVRDALQLCVSQADKLLARDADAVQAVFDGLIITGVAMNYAGLSRPASGVEHYISHVVDMRAAQFGTPEDLHGIQCAVGTLISVKLYEKLKGITPNKEKALSYAQSFSYAEWAAQLTDLLGSAADSMIALEAKEKKYDPDLHARRLEILLKNWDAILKIIDEELPTVADTEALLDTIGAPKTLSQIGTPDDMLPDIFKATKDIRDKYVLSRLCWDLGILDEITK